MTGNGSSPYWHFSLYTSALLPFHLFRFLFMHLVSHFSSGDILILRLSYRVCFIHVFEHKCCLSMAVAIAYFDDFRASIRSFLPGGNTFRLETPGKRVVAGFLNSREFIDISVPRAGVWYHIALQFGLVRAF